MPRCASMKVKSYKKGEWESRKDHIIKLYTEDNKSVDQVIKTLAATGFYVNKRMIMTRVMQWGIGRNHKLPEMCAAIYLLLDDDFDNLDGNTSFTIRGDVVSLREIRKYFRRKGISNPVEYVKRNDNAQPPIGLDVQLRKKVTKATTSDQQPLVAYADSSDDLTLVGPASDATTLCVPDQLTTTGTPHTKQKQSTSIHIRMTQSCRDSDRILWSIASYITSYADSSRQQNHHEPQVHHLTAHGRFGTLMQEGISLKNRGELTPAFNQFDRGFDLLRVILADDHPMSLALLLTIICELERNKLHAITQQLGRHIVEMLQLEDKSSHPISILFRALGNCDAATTGHVLRTLRRAGDDLLLACGKEDWRSLYVKERLCDALYYASEDNERLDLRRNLYEDQVERYGENARNVLWTQAIIADDLSSLGQYGNAQRVYEEVIERAEQLEGFGKAKTRFAALEGLGSTQRKAAALDMFDANAMVLLGQALRNLEMAEQEATVWFETSSRRLERVRKQKDDVLQLIATCL